MYGVIIMPIMPITIMPIMPTIMPNIVPIMPMIMPIMPIIMPILTPMCVACCTEYELVSGTSL